MASRLDKIQDGLQSIISAYRYMGISPKRYAFKYLGPAVLVSLLLIVLNLTVLRGSTVEPFLYLSAVVTSGLALTYPRIVIGFRSNEIEQKFHLFITHLTVLSLTQTSRVEIFRTIAEEDDYGALADEIGRMVGLIDTWNMSLDDACRNRAQKVHAEVMANFYEQVAYNVGSGQPLSEFLVNEQSAFIRSYSARYEANVNRVEFYAELFVSTMLVTSFGVMFTILIPFLIGGNPTKLVGGVLLFSVLSQALFMFAIDTFSPEDYLWYTPENMSTPTQDRAWLIFGGSLIGVAVLAALTYAYATGKLFIKPNPDIPFYIYPAVPTTPLLIPGLYIHLQESALKRIDDQFPAFLRALGAIESVKQTSTANVLNGLRHKDFGPLTEHIVALYRRLNLNVDSVKSWRHFSAEIGSALIKSFADMYTLGRDLGGDPETLGNVISENFNTVLTLREKRAQIVGSASGQLRAITVTTATTFFTGLEILKMMLDMTKNLSAPNMMSGEFLYTSVYSIPTLTTVIFITVAINCLLASLLIKKADRKHIIGATFHFTTLFWVSCMGGALARHLFTQVSFF